jgi:hypothetical protein
MVWLSSVGLEQRQDEVPAIVSICTRKDLGVAQGESDNLEMEVYIQPCLRQTFQP